MAGRGGYRPGAGRKPTHAKQLAQKAKDLANRVTAAQILSSIDEIKAWTELINSESEKIRLQTLMYLTDRRDGKARQLEDQSKSGKDAIKIVVIGNDQVQAATAHGDVVMLPPSGEA